MTAQTVPPKVWEWLVCPHCVGPLTALGGELQCSACRKRWPVVDGVPHFVSDFPYWGEIPLSQMREVNRAARFGSWKSALLSSGEPSVQKAAEMILNLERANWQWLVDLPPGGRVLDMGAGTGTNAHALALRCGDVVALEPVLERVEFMRYRFAQERLHNVRVVRSSLWALPFAPESFDLVIMNGVLEWVAEGQSGDPGELQGSALQSVHRLLRPGGTLYIGIENRLCPEYLIGYLDPHCRLPFVTVLPRPLANWYARKHGRDGYRNYLYSSYGYRKLLRTLGFRSINIYLALPSYNHPRYLIPLRHNVFSYYTRNFTPLHGSRIREIAHEVLLQSGALKHMQDSFVILARR